MKIVDNETHAGLLPKSGEQFNQLFFGEMMREKTAMDDIGIKQCWMRFQHIGGLEVNFWIVPGIFLRVFNNSRVGVDSRKTCIDFFLSTPVCQGF